MWCTAGPRGKIGLIPACDGPVIHHYRMARVWWLVTRVARAGARAYQVLVVYKYRNLDRSVMAY